MTQDTQSQDPFEFLKRLWAPMGLPMPGALAPLLDPNEIEKRISDLRSVENWLALNLNVLRMTIQGLEAQRAALSAFQAMQAPLASGAQAAADATARSQAAAADEWWRLLQQAQAAAAPAPPPDPKRDKKAK
jgi:hypothetical protein